MPEQSEIDTPLQRDSKPDPMSLERHQPDPMLDMSGRRMGGGAISLVAVAIVMILAIVLFGLNGRSTDTRPTLSTPIAAR